MNILYKTPKNYEINFHKEKALLLLPYVLD